MWRARQGRAGCSVVPRPCQGPQERLSPRGGPRAGAVAWLCPFQGSRPSFCFHPDTVALEGGWALILFQSLP